MLLGIYIIRLKMILSGKMKDNLDSIRKSLELKEGHFNDNIRQFFNLIGLEYSEKNRKLMKSLIFNGVLLQQLNYKEYVYMFKEAYTLQIRWYRLLGKIRKPFSRIRHLISGLFNRECLCHTCIEKALETRHCGMMKYFEEKDNITDTIS